MKEPLSARVRKSWKQLIDENSIHENSGFNKEKKNPSRARASGNRCKYEPTNLLLLFFVTSNSTQQLV